MATFQVDLGQPAAEYLQTGIFWSYGDRGGGDNWSYKTCNTVKSSSPTNRHPTLFYMPDAFPVAKPTT